MITIYVVSTSSFSGKSAIAIGLGRQLMRDGFSVGYMKPVGTTVHCVAGQFIDEDASFIKEVFDLPTPVQDLAPFTLNASTVEKFLTDMDEKELRQKLLQAFAEASKGKEIVILEGAGDLAEGSLAGFSAREVADLFQAHTIVVAKYARDLVVDDLLLAGKIMGPRLVGAVINSVPPMRQDFTQRVMKPFLEKNGVNVLAILPEERVLLSTSVREIASCLGGQILCCEDSVEELVEDLMVGAMSAESALAYFRRSLNKAVITGGDRPDIQLAALQTSTKCLILTGSLYPSPVILGHAEEAEVPIILVGYDTLTTVEMLQQFFGRTRFHQPEKMELFQKLLGEHFDFARLYASLGLSPPEGQG